MKPHLDSFVPGVAYGQAPEEIIESPWGTPWFWDADKLVYCSPGATPRSRRDLQALWTDADDVPWVATDRRKLVVRAGQHWIVVIPKTVALARAVSIKIPYPLRAPRSDEMEPLRSNVMHRDTCARFAAKVAQQYGEIFPCDREQMNELLG